MFYDRRYTEICPAMPSVGQCIGDHLLISNKGQDKGNFNCLLRPKIGVIAAKSKRLELKSVKSYVDDYPVLYWRLKNARNK